MVQDFGMNTQNETSGWESDADFGIWFTTGSEHGVEVYDDIQGNLIRAAIE